MLAVGLVVALVFVHLWVALHALAPVYWEDEAGYLLNAQTIAGFGETVDLQGMSYYPGWSLFLVPLWWILQDPDVVYRAATVLSAVFAILTVAPLALIGRKFELTWAQSFIAASVVLLGPGRALMSGFALAENCLTFFFALTVLLALNYAKYPNWRVAALFGTLAAFTFIVHGRAVPVVIAAVLWFVWQLMHKRWHALAGLSAVVIVVFAGLTLYRWLGQLIYPTTGREADGIEKVFTSAPWATALAGAGQLWFHFAASAGLAAIGLVVIFVFAYRELRSRQPLALTWLALVFLGLMAISFTYISDGVLVLKPRLDIYVYGRYLDPFVSVLTMAGAIALFRIRSRKFVALVGGSTLALMAVYVLVARAVIPGLENGGWWAPLNVLGLMQWNWPGRGGTSAIPYLWPSLVTALSFGLMYILRKNVMVIMVIFAVYFSGSSVVASAYGMRPFVTSYYSAFSLKDVVREFSANHTLSFDTLGLSEQVPVGDTVSRNAYQYWLVPYSPSVFSSDSEEVSTELVISRPDWVHASDLGARLIAIDSVFENALWVMPGQLQTSLEDSGRLIDSAYSP
jgi:hypothetical protein